MKLVVFLAWKLKDHIAILYLKKGYAGRLLNRFNMGESKVMSSPMEPWLKLIKQEGQPMEDATLFQEPNGGLFYLTIKRPDIAYSIGFIS